MKWALQPWGPPATAILPYSALGRRGDVTPSLLRRRWLPSPQDGRALQTLASRGDGASGSRAGTRGDAKDPKGPRPSVMSHAGLSTGTAPQQHGQSSRAGWGPRGSQHTQRAPCRRPSGQPWLPDAEIPGTCSCSHWGQVTWETPPDRCLSSTTQVLGTSAGRGTPCGPSSAHRAWSRPLQHVSALLSHLLRPPGTHTGREPPHLHVLTGRVCAVLGDRK